MSRSKTTEQHQDLNIATAELVKFRYSAQGKMLQLDQVIAEQPLQIRLLWRQTDEQAYQSKIFSITMRTPGNDKALIIGLMQSEGIIQCFQQIESIAPEISQDEAQTAEQINTENEWQVKLKSGVVPDIKSLERFQVTYSSCGLCGTTSLKSLEMKSPPVLSEHKHWLAFNVICAMPTLMRAAQSQFVQTGGSHAAALFDQQGVLIDLKEDIGRHNALDKLLGANLMQHDTCQSQYSVLVSGRISFEIVQKTVMAGVNVLIAVGAPSELAILAAKRFNLTLIGFTKSDSFNLYHGDWRLIPWVPTE